MSEPMREAYAATGKMAKTGGAETGITFSVSGTTSPLQIAITDFFKMQHPRKTWGFLCDLLGVGERVAKHRIANTRAYTIEELQLMLQSEDGLAILETLMADAEPAWWAWLRKTMKLADARRKQVEIQQEVLLLETSGPVETGTRRRLNSIRISRFCTSGRRLPAGRSAKCRGRCSPVTSSCHCRLMKRCGIKRGPHLASMAS
jgi:hypothetical protein